jgi:hypothetical protein
VRTGGPVAVADVVSLHAPLVVEPGADVDVAVNLAGRGDLQALSLALGWDASVVQPLGTSPGKLVTEQGGVVLSPGPGMADAALLGIGDGMTGEGTVAHVRFRALKGGDPQFAVAHVIGRDGQNHGVTVLMQGVEAAKLPVTATDLLPVIPNPTRGSALVQYALARAGSVHLAIYSVDGRLVKTLVNGAQDPGRYQLSWDGTDAHGTLLRSGMFYVRLEAAGVRQARVLSVIR